MTERNYKFVTVAVAVASLTPLLLMNHDMWDMVRCEMAYTIGDFSLIKHWLCDLGYYLKYYTYVVTTPLSTWTGIPNKVFTNVLSVVSVLGIAREMFRLLIEKFGYERKFAYLGAWTVIAFPVWHTLLSSAVFINILCLWLFMISVRLWRTNKPLSVLFFIPSIQLFSVFAMAVGFIASDFVLTVTRPNCRDKVTKGFFSALALLVGFILFTSLVNIHGPKNVHYNSFTFEQIGALGDYGVMAAIFLLLGFALKRTVPAGAERERFLRHLYSFLILAFFAALPYWAVGRPLRFFAFGSFTARHTYLTCIPFALLVAFTGDYLSKRIGPKTCRGLACVLLLTLVVLQHQGYSHKVAAMAFRDMLTQAFAATEAPPSGYVGIVPVGYKPPRHVHMYAINMSLFRAYGRSAWMANGFWRRDIFPSREALEKIYNGADIKGTTKALALDVTGDAYTRYTFTLDGYHQEGRVWYWYCYLTGDYHVFNPRLERVAD